jgi:hypothetical protein
MARLARRLLSSFLSPVVKYHGLGRATGFGSVRPCNTLASLRDATRTVAPSRTDGIPARAGLRIRPFQARGVTPCFLPSSVLAEILLTATSKIDCQTDRAVDSQLTPSFTGCPTSR